MREDRSELNNALDTSDLVNSAAELRRLSHDVKYDVDLAVERLSQVVDDVKALSKMVVQKAIETEAKIEQLSADRNPFDNNRMSNNKMTLETRRINDSNSISGRSNIHSQSLSAACERLFGQITILESSRDDQSRKKN